MTTPTNNCCQQCYGRQGTRAGGGIYCDNTNCPCHNQKSVGEFKRLANTHQEKNGWGLRPSEGVEDACEYVDELLAQRERAVREEIIRDMERKMSGWAGTATAMLKDYRKIIYGKVQK